MGQMSFTLPAGLTPDVLRELGRACVTGGPDNMPWPTEVRLDAQHMSVRRDVDESGCLAVPWEVGGAGRLMGMTGTLIERHTPYQFGIELARGKVHQLRCQAADWQAGGLAVPGELLDQIRAAAVRFGKAVSQPAAEQAAHAQAALAEGYRTADRLAGLYVEQMFAARHVRQPRLDAALGVRLGAAPLTPGEAAALRPACNALGLSFAWNEVEPVEASYNWQPFDTLLAWAAKEGLAVGGGPLIDFSPARLPDWLWLWQRDLSSLASFMCDYVETVIKRYAGQVRIWQLTNASNSATILGLGEDEYLWLTARLMEAARQVDPKLELVVGIAQPWGEYMAVDDRTHSPFIFADTLIRSGLHLSALDLEVVMGAAPRGSYCRDLLDFSRLIDLYSLLGVPLRLTLGYPSANKPDPHADPELAVAAGHWRGGFSPEVQADWAAAYAAMAVCKPSVRAVQWVHGSDAESHQFPHCGLFDARRAAKPAVERLRVLREAHLR